MIFFGSQFGDWFEGGADANLLTGLAGSDTMSGLAGNDSLVGGRGNDWSPSGGAGIDRFVFVTGDGTDRIADFEAGVDKAELRQANVLSDLTFTQQGADVRVGLRHLDRHLRRHARGRPARRLELSV